MIKNYHDLQPSTSKIIGFFRGLVKQALVCIPEAHQMKCPTVIRALPIEEPVKFFVFPVVIEDCSKKVQEAGWIEDLLEEEEFMLVPMEVTSLPPPIWKLPASSFPLVSVMLFELIVQSPVKSVVPSVDTTPPGTQLVPL